MASLLVSPRPLPPRVINVIIIVAHRALAYYEKNGRQHPWARIFEKSTGNAFEYVYGVLSHDIHAYPRSDESVVELLILMRRSVPYPQVFCIWTSK